MISRLSSRILDRAAGRFERLYGAAAVPRCLERLAMLVGRYGVGIYGQRHRDPLDQSDVVLIAYGDSILEEGAPPLQALHRFIRTHLKGAVSMVHILPFFPYSSDDGFSVIDYREVRPELGTWADIEAIGQDFGLMFDLVLNHCSRRSAWFEDFVAGICPGRHFFLEVEPNTDLSLVARPRTTPLLSRVPGEGGERWLWTTFSEDQLDLNFASPDVLFEFLDILLWYLSKGARMIRLDAIAYLWKRIGTACIHLPETHEIVKLMRDLLDMVDPSVLILTETNVPHAENVSYFGDGDEARLVYQFSLPPLLLHALITGDASRLTAWAAALAPPPAGCTFLNFTASHDGIGVRPLQGLLSNAEMDGLIEHVRRCGGEVSMKHNPDGSESPYELNVSYFDAMGVDAADSSSAKRRRFLASQTVALALQGVPAVYLHSLTATPNDRAGVRETGRARSINRHRWQRSELAARLKDSTSDTALVMGEYVRRLRLRAQSRCLNPNVPQRVLDLGPHMFAVERFSEEVGEGLVCITNFTAKRVRTPPAHTLFSMQGITGAVDVMRSGRRIDLSRPVTLGPYQTVWMLGQREGGETS